MTLQIMLGVVPPRRERKMTRGKREIAGYFAKVLRHVVLVTGAVWGDDPKDWKR